MKPRFLMFAAAVGLATAALVVMAVVGGFVGSANATTSTVVVKPSAMNGWYFWNDKNDIFTGSPGELVPGPLAPPLGAGSVRLGPLTDNGATAAGHSVIATNAYAGTALADITTLSYSTFQPGPTLAIALQFDVRYRTTDLAYGGRLVFEPYQNGLVSVGSGWQSWSPLNGKWWASKTTAAGTGGVQAVPLPAGNCSQATPCTWSEITAAFPDAVIGGRFLLKAGSNWNGFDGNADALTVGISGTDTTFNFEPETACTTTCYADAVNGNDAFGGDSPASAKKTIQAAINQVSANGQVRVLPGNYHESAPGSAPTSLGGTYQFGLFFGSGKPGISLIGVTAGDVPITDAAATQATITTDATNNFGTDGIFVEAADTTIQGVKIGPNDSGDNKTIEVVADNFTLQYSTTDIPGGGGSIYIDDFSAGGTVVKSYHVLDNVFPDGTSVDIASGAGSTGPVAGREILRNAFDLGSNGFNAISFNGTGGVPWFANPVGGAIIKNNSFANSTQYIRARGVYAESQFDWASYWNDNAFDRAAVALVTQVPFDVRSYAYSVFTNVRRIGGTIQGEVDHAVAGDTVLVKAGTYDELVTVPKSLTINGAQAGNAVGGRTFGNAAESTVNGRFTVQAADVTLDGFSITSPGLNIGVLLKTAADNASVENDIFDTIGSATATDPVQAIYLENGPDDVTILNNRIANVQSKEQSAKGIYVGDTTATNASDGIVIEGNSISNIRSAWRGAYGIQANNNTGTGNAVIRGNTIDDLAGGIDPAPSSPNRGWAHAIGLEGDTANVLVEKNVITNIVDANPDPVLGPDAIAVWFEDNPSFATGHVNRNSLAVGIAAAGIVVHPALGAGPVDGTCNWWGSATGPDGAGAGSGSAVGPGVTFQPWLTSSNLTGACNGGTARGNKQVVLAELQALAPIDPATDKEIAKAIGHLRKSVNSSAWVDDNHLAGKKAHKVFDEEQETIEALGEIENPSADLAAGIAGWIDSLVAADRTLATTAISEGGSARALARANNELAKGDIDRDNGKFEKAIAHYESAWKALRG